MSGGAAAPDTRMCGKARRPNVLLNRCYLHLQCGHSRRSAGGHVESYTAVATKQWGPQREPGYSTWTSDGLV